MLCAEHFEICHMIIKYYSYYTFNIKDNENEDQLDKSWCWFDTEELSTTLWTHHIF